MKRIVIVVDLGHFKAYKLFKNPMESPRMEMIGTYDTLEAHGKLADKLTDGAGKFGLGGGRNGVKGYGEQHNLELENEKRLVKHLVRNINDLISRENCEQWYLAAGKKLNRQIVEILDIPIKKKLTKNITSDLTKAKKSDILIRFEKA